MVVEWMLVVVLLIQEQRHKDTLGHFILTPNYRLNT